MKKYLTERDIRITYISNAAAKSTAQMILISGIKSHCANYDPFGMDTVIDCLNCENSEFRIIDDENNVLIDFKAKEKIGKLVINHSQEEIKAAIKILTKKDDYKKNHLKYDTYTIQFFENYNPTNIIDYLKNNNSNYRIIRNSDNECMRISKIEKKLRDDKYKRQDEEIQKAMDLYIDDFDGMEINISNEEIPKNNKVKSFIRKLIKRK